MRDRIMTRGALAREAAQSAPTLPLEIWRLVAQELASRGDSRSLFSCACTCQGVANMALPLLYAIHEESSSADDSASFWRSLVHSAMEKTMWPYVTWVKSLKFSSLMSLLEDIRRGLRGRGRGGEQLMATLSSLPPPSTFVTVQNGNGTGNGNDHLGARSNTVLQVADLLTRYIQVAAIEGNKAAQLSFLEGSHLPTPYLVEFVPRLSTLMSLAVHDGSVLDRDVGMAIAKSCPAFKELCVTPPSSCQQCLSGTHTLL
jgi:hypothetical protein